MLKTILVLSMMTCMINTSAFGETRAFDEKCRKQIDAAVNAAIALEMTPGAVVAAGRRDGVIFQNAYGQTMYEDGKPVTTETIYDLASLSKVIGTTTSIMILAERGKLELRDPVSKYLSGMATADKKEITIEQCLLHRAGFVPDNPLKDFEDGREKALERVYDGKLRYKPGEDFDYSDNSMIVLGEVVKAVSGKPLSEFARENVFEPLKMTRTAYLPPVDWNDHIAPTEKRDGKWMLGQVHDPRAHLLGGFAGHAGVFANAGDVARFCRMMLNRGELDGVRVLSEKTIAEMTKPRPLINAKGEKTTRAYGFDIDSRLSAAPRGKRFAKGKTFGHTGYTGTSMWIDPENDAFVVILTNRVHPDDEANITPLRKRVATIVAEALVEKSN